MPLGSTLQIDRSEWESFLEKLAEFEKKYNLLLSKIDAMQTAPSTIQQPGPEKAEPSVVASVMSEIPVPSRQKESLLSRLNRSLKMPSPTAARSVGPVYFENGAHCSRCRWQLTQPTKYCHQCGTGFGAVICPCGRQLGPGDKFCDGCGRAVSA